jgi:serine/threonine-protein kinase
LGGLVDDPTVTVGGNSAPAEPIAETTWREFQLLEKVGQGSFGEVYRAFDTRLQREVAVKLLLPRSAGAGSQEEALLREARAMARVRHPNVVAIYGVDRHAGRAGFWMDFVKGRTLSAIIEADGLLGPRETALIGIDVCKAVGAVHAAGLLHRDIKASNTMRESGGRIVLMDFGLTHSALERQYRGGTPAYMAPEQLDGRPASTASDIYGLGVLLYHLLTGKYPEPGKALLDARPDLPEALAGVVETAVHRDPEKRYKSAGAMIAALTAAAGLGLAAAESRKPLRRRGWLLVAGVAAVAIAAAIPLVRQRAAPAIVTAGVDGDYRKAHELLEHYYRPRSMETAIPLLEAIVERNPTFAPGFAALGRANLLQFIQLRDPKFIEPARQASLRALDLKSGLASPHVTLGALYTHTGKMDLASQELDEALRLDQYNGPAHGAQGELYYKLGRAKEAEAALEKAVSLAPGDWALVQQLGAYYLETGRLAKAREQYQKAADLAPDNPRPLTNLAEINRMEGRAPEALAAIRKAITLEPTFSRHRNLGQILLEQGNYEEARPSFERAIEMAPDHYRAWGLLAEVYLATGVERKKAEETLRKAIALAGETRKHTPTDAYLIADIATYHAALGSAASSEPLLKQAAALAPDKPAVLVMVAAAYERLRNREQALYWLGRAIHRGWPRRFVEQLPQFGPLRADPRYRAIVSP